MNQTPNYQLSQWEAADQVKREDFNADNAKIDAALAEASHLRVIKTITVPQNTKRLDIKLSDMVEDPENYLWLELWLRNVRCDKTGAVKLNINNITETVYSSSGTYGSSPDAVTFNSFQNNAGAFHINGFVRYYPTSGVIGGTYGKMSRNDSGSQHSGNFYHGAWGLSEYHIPEGQEITFNLTSNDVNILSGGKIVVRGFKL